MRANVVTTAKNRKVIRKLIQAYNEMPFLWDKKHKDYLNRHRRHYGHKKLTEIYKEIEADASIPSLRRKIDNLRGVYLRELKKVKASELNARDPEDIYEPSLWHYQDMSFLEAVMVPQITLQQATAEDEVDGECTVNQVKVEDPLDSDTNEECLESEYEDVDVGADCSSPIQPSTSSPVQISTSSSAPPSTSNIRGIEEEDIIGKSIGVQLRDLPKKQKVIALKLISDAVYFANLGKLKETSFVNL